MELCIESPDTAQPSAGETAVFALSCTSFWRWRVGAARHLPAIMASMVLITLELNPVRFSKHLFIRVIRFVLSAHLQAR